MGWRTTTVMRERREFVEMALNEGVNKSELCRRFGISRKTGYKFIRRYTEEGPGGLGDRSRRPENSPNATGARVEELILGLRDAHPAWGGRKLKRRLEDMGHECVPSASTITSILKRRGRIREEESHKHRAWERFESERVNDMWQMDFKGHFPASEGRCHPLTVLDDKSRYALEVGACADERKETVKSRLSCVFGKYGMPVSMLMDNGSPWGGSERRGYTGLTVWLLRLGVGVIHSRPYHPETLGKDERLHRTMSAEVVSECVGKTMEECQERFDSWRLVYNLERPHEALGMEVPAKHYRPSERSFPEKLPEIEYCGGDHVRKVQEGGIVHYRGRELRVGSAFRGYPVAIRETAEDGVFNVFFCTERIAQISLR